MQTVRGKNVLGPTSSRAYENWVDHWAGHTTQPFGLRAEPIPKVYSSLFGNIHNEVYMCRERESEERRT